MTISSPTFAGGIYQRNRTSWTITPNADIPAGAMLWLVCGGSIADDSVITVTDGAGNSYAVQINSQQPGTVGTMFVYLCPNSLGLTTAQTLTINSDNRGDLLANLYYFTGARGSLYSTDVEWNAGAQPSGTCQAQAGMGVFSVLAVAGPNNDGFTQASGWGADILSNIQTVNATIHGGFQVASADGPITYAPTLGSNRQSVVLVASFR